MSPPLLSHLSKLCHNNNKPQLSGECFQQGYSEWMLNWFIKIHFYGIGLILVLCTPAQRSLNTVIDGFGSRNALTYYGYLRVKFLSILMVTGSWTCKKMSWALRSEQHRWSINQESWYFFLKTNLTCLYLFAHTMSLYWLQQSQDMDWLYGKEVSWTWTPLESSGG